MIFVTRTQKNAAISIYCEFLLIAFMQMHVYRHYGLHRKLLVVWVIYRIVSGGLGIGFAVNGHLKRIEIFLYAISFIRRFQSCSDSDIYSNYINCLAFSNSQLTPTFTYLCIFQIPNQISLMKIQNMRNQSK